MTAAKRSKLICSSNAGACLEGGGVQGAQPPSTPEIKKKVIMIIPVIESFFLCID